MYDFFSFLLTKVYNSKLVHRDIIQRALEKTIDDIKYHFPKLSSDQIEQNIKKNSNELAVFLYRIGSELHCNNLEELKYQIHWLLKELCCCEIYFNTEINEGFYIVHGQGTIIGSRNKIGKGFIIHQGCTIGHKKNGVGNGNVIGNNVTLYCNSSILGELNIGDNVVIGAHVLVTNHIEDNIIVVANTDNLYKSRKF